jgi:hypothetical protein
MDRRTRWIVTAAGALTLLAGGGAGLAASGVVAEEGSLTGSTLDKASEAALEATGGGAVTDSEAGDDGATYGVEVRLDDGRQVEVNLDEKFEVIGQEADDDGPNDADGPNDD